MGNPLTAAQDQIQAQKRALLENMAQNGTAAAQQTYAQAQADVAAQKAQTIKAALAEAGRAGAPPEAAAGITSKLSAPYDRRALDLSSSATSHQQLLGTMSQANDEYLQQASSAVPALQALVDRKIAELRADAADKAAQRQFAAQQHQWAMEEHQARLDAAQKPPSLSSIVSDNGGADFLGQRLGELSAPNSGQSKYAETEHTLYGTPNDPQGSELGALGASLGLPSGYAANLAATSASKAAKASTAAQAVNGQQHSSDDVAAALGIRDVEGLRSLSAKVTAPGKTKGTSASPFQDALDTYHDGVSKNMLPQEIDAALSRGLIQKYGHDFPEVRRLALAMWSQ